MILSKAARHDAQHPRTDGINPADDEHARAQQLKRAAPRWHRSRQVGLHTPPPPPPPRARTRTRARTRPAHTHTLHTPLPPPSAGRAVPVMAGKKGDNSKKAQGNARKAEAASQKAAQDEARLEAAEADKWQKGAKSSAKK